MLCESGQKYIAQNMIYYKSSFAILVLVISVITSEEIYEKTEERLTGPNAESVLSVSDHDNESRKAQGSLEVDPIDVAHPERTSVKSDSKSAFENMQSKTDVSSDEKSTDGSINHDQRSSSIDDEILKTSPNKEEDSSERMNDNSKDDVSSEQRIIRDISNDNTENRAYNLKNIPVDLIREVRTMADYILDTKGRSGANHDLENHDEVRAVSASDYRTFDNLNPFDKRSHSSNIMSPQIQALIPPGFLHRPSLYPVQPTAPNHFFRRINQEINNQFDRYTNSKGTESQPLQNSEYFPTQLEHNQALNADANAYPYVVPVHTHTENRRNLGDNQKSYKKMAETSNYPKTFRRASFSEEYIKPYSNLYNAFDSIVYPFRIFNT